MILELEEKVYALNSCKDNSVAAHVKCMLQCEELVYGRVIPTPRVSATFKLTLLAPYSDILTSIQTKL
jgi:hypothetical protein